MNFIAQHMKVCTSLLLFLLFWAGRGEGLCRLSASPQAPLPLSSTDVMVLDNTVEGSSFQWKGLRVDGFSGKLRMTLHEEGWSVVVTDGKAGKLSWPSLPFPSLLQGWRFGGTLHWSAAQGDLRVEEARVEVPGLGAFALEAFFPGKGETGARVHAEGSKLLVKGIHRLCFPRFKDFSADGRLGAEIDLERSSPGSWRWRATVQARDLTVWDSSYLHGCEKLKLQARGEGEYRESTGDGPLRTEWSIDGGEAVLGRFYFDFARTPLHAAFRGAMNLRRLRFAVDRLGVGLGEIVNGALKGSIQRSNGLWEGRLHATFPMQPASPFLKAFFREPWGEQMPRLKKVRWQGNWQWDLSWDGPFRAPSVEGRVALDDFSWIDEDGGILLERIRGEIPLWLDFSPSFSREGAKPGRLRIGSFQAGRLSGRDVALSFGILPNGFRLAAPLDLFLNRQALKVRRLEFRDVLRPSRAGELEVETGGLRLDFFLEDLPGRESPVRILTPRWRLALEDGALAASEDLAMEAFSGKVFLESFEIRRIFAPDRLVTMDMRWSGVDLEQLTAVTEFGKITGRLQGEVRGLELSRGGPVAFHLTLHSMPVPEVSRRISVAAVENLARIGASQSPFQGLAGGVIATFFKDFYYREIGIRCTLKNDFFSVGGLIREEGVEYLVKGSAVRGVEIVNRSSRNRIAWDDMIRRLQRVGRPPAAEEP